MGADGAEYSAVLTPFSGAGGTALPKQANLAARWSADSIAPVADGTAVPSWTDSINGYVATQATGIRQPLYKTNVRNGKPALWFNSQWMDAGRPAAVVSAMDTGSRTVLVVYQTVGATSNGMLFNTAPAGGGAFMMVADGTNAGRFSFTMPHANTGQLSTLGCIRANGSAGGYRQSFNSSIAYVNDIDSTTSGGNNIYFGGIQNNTFMCNAYIFDILVWNVALTMPELLQAEAWARDKYGDAYPWAAKSDYIIYAGDSLTQGSGALGAGSYPYKSAQTLTRPYGTWTNIAAGGTTMAEVNANCAINADPIPAQLGKVCKIAAFEYYNQRGLGAAGCETQSRAYLAARKAIPNMKTVFGTSTGHSGDPDAVRSAYDALFAGGQSNIDAYVPLHTDTSIGNYTAYATNSAAYWSDVVHFNSAGYTILSNLMTAGIQALP
jgi:hypothetical protein